MENLELKKAIFTSNEIVLFRKKGDIVISINDINWIEYQRPTFFSLLLAGLLPDGNFPGNIKILLNKRIGKSKTYFVRIKYKDVLKLPQFYLRKIDPAGRLI